MNAGVMEISLLVDVGDRMLRKALTMSKWKWTVVMFASGGVYGFLKGYGIL